MIGVIWGPGGDETATCQSEDCSPAEAFPAAFRCRNTDVSQRRQLYRKYLKTNPFARPSRVDWSPLRPGFLSHLLLLRQAEGRIQVPSAFSVVLVLKTVQRATGFKDSRFKNSPVDTSQCRRAASLRFRPLGVIPRRRRAATG